MIDGALQIASARDVDAFQSGIVGEPADLITSTLVDQTTRQCATLLSLEDLLEDVLLASSSSDKGNLCSMEDNGQTESNAFGWRLGRVRDAQDPGIGFAQQRVFGEERASVAIGTAAKKEQVEGGEFDRVAGGKDRDELLLILVGALLSVVEVFLLNGVDLGLAESFLVNLVQQLILEEFVVAVFVIQWDAALVGEEDFPLAEIDSIGRCAVALGQKCLGESLGQRAS